MLLTPPVAVIESRRCVNGERGEMTCSRMAYTRSDIGAAAMYICHVQGGSRGAVAPASAAAAAARCCWVPPPVNDAGVAVNAVVARERCEEKLRCDSDIRSGGEFDIARRTYATEEEFASVVWEVVPFWRFEPARVKPIKLVYDPDRQGGRLSLTARAFN